MNPLQVGLMYGGLAAVCELVLVVARRVGLLEPDDTARKLRALRLALYAIVMLGGGALLRPQVETWLVVRAINSTFAADSSLATIARRHPDLFEQVRVAVRRGSQESIRTGSNAPIRTATRDAMRSLTHELMPMYFGAFPDDELVAFWRAWFNRVKRVADVDSGAALEMLAGASGWRGDSLENVELGGVGLLGIAAAIRRPGPPPDSAAAETARIRLMNQLTERFGSATAVLEDPTNPTINPRLARAVALSFWDVLLGMPPAEAAAFLRYHAGPDVSEAFARD